MNPGVKRWLYGILLLAVAWELLARPVILTFWPDAELPESLLTELLNLLMSL